MSLTLSSKMHLSNTIQNFHSWLLGALHNHQSLAPDSQLARVSLPQPLMGAAVYSSLILQLQERQQQTSPWPRDVI